MPLHARGLTWENFPSTLDRGVTRSEDGHSAPNSNEMKGAECAFRGPSPSAFRGPRTHPREQKRLVSRRSSAAGPCALHAVVESGAALGIHCDAFPRGEARIPPRIARGATALDKRPEGWLSSLPPLGQRTALLPTWSLNMQGSLRLRQAPPGVSKSSQGTCVKQRGPDCPPGRGPPTLAKTRLGFLPSQQGVPPVPESSPRGQGPPLQSQPSSPGALRRASVSPESTFKHSHLLKK